MNTIPLWDNSWHVEDLGQPNEKKDLFGRTPYPLTRLTNDDTKAILAISSRTISEWTQLEGEDSVLVIPNSFQDGNDDLKDQYIFRVSAKDGKKIDSITTNNVVGFIGKGNTDIRIHSRFSNQKGEINDCFLYYMLEKVMAINFFNLPTSISDKDPIFDFLLFYFPKLLKEALSQGLYKKYMYHEYNDANVRGVIDINRHIRCNISANGRIAYRTRDFSYDNPMTQLIRHTIEFIRYKPFGKVVLHNDPDTEACVQQIIQATPSFTTRKQQMVINDNLRPLVHPYYTKYAALQKLCLCILRHEKLSYDSKTSDNKIHGILIDAAWLWEEYVAKILAESNKLKHYTRMNPFDLFRNGNQRFQKIIPDYLDEENHIVADAKYIPLHKYDHLSADRALTVYYKTIMYMYRFESKNGFLFHPCAGEDVSGSNDVILSDYTIITSTNDCHLYEVGMVIPSVKSKEHYSDFKEKMNNAEKAFISVLDSTISQRKIVR